MLYFDDLEPGQVVLDTRDNTGVGYALYTTDRGTIRFDMCDGWNATYWECDSGILCPNFNHHVTVIVDGGPKAIYFVIDGVLCDGGETRLFAYCSYQFVVKN